MNLNENEDFLQLKNLVDKMYDSINARLHRIEKVYLPNIKKNFGIDIFSVNCNSIERDCDKQGHEFTVVSGGKNQTVYEILWKCKYCGTIKGTGVKTIKA